jgi:hypothetical protein
MNRTSPQFGPLIDGGGAAAEPAGPVVKPKIKVSQATVDAVKSAGESKSYGATKYKGVSPEYTEAVRRIYPNAAKKSAAASQKSKTSSTPQSPRVAERKASTPAPIKVSQATIDAIKKAGKEKSIGALKYKGVSAEYKEGVRRLYQSPAKPKAKAPKPKGGGGPSRGSAAVM